MSYLALYRKYRPNNFDDLVGQTEISSIIKNEILTGRISHAYLFSGPRGTGKTSTAKIIAKMINCSNLKSDGIPCGECESCLNLNSSSDVVEIDAASNNGVDEIRELRDKVNLVPTKCKYKIYIIDEVHMLTTQAFNALLKTLEEPPSHVIFILATTEFHKIPVTVVSRCQKFQFLKFNIEDIMKKLKEIALSESIVVSDDVLFEISRLSDGGLRDAINMLDQLSSFKSSDLTVNDVYNLNGVISYNEFKLLLDYVHNNDVSSIVSFFENIDKTGKNFERFIEDFISFLKDILVFKNTNNLDCAFKEKRDCINYLNDLYDNNSIYELIILLNDISIRIKNSSFGKILLITEFIKFSNKIRNFIREKDSNLCNSVKDVVKLDNTIEYFENRKNTRIDNLKNDINSNDNPNNINKLFTKDVSVPFGDNLKKIRINNAFVSASKKYKEFFVEKWNLVLDKVSTDLKYASISRILGDIEVLVVGEKNVIFLAPYDSLLERLNLHINLIEKVIEQVFELKYKIVFLLKDEWDFERNKYINNLKSSYKYSYIDEDDGSCIGNNENNIIKDDDIEKLISILGNDVITYK